MSVQRVAICGGDFDKWAQRRKVGGWGIGFGVGGARLVRLGARFRMSVRKGGAFEPPARGTWGAFGGNGYVGSVE